MDDGVDKEAGAALLVVVDVVEELTRVSSRVVKRKEIKTSAVSVWKVPDAWGDDSDRFDCLESRR